MLIRGNCRSLHQVLDVSGRQSVTSSELAYTDEEITGYELEIQQHQSKAALLESSLNEQRKINVELESDLKIALSEGIKYRDSLKRMIEIQEQESIRSLARK